MVGGGEAPFCGGGPVGERNALMGSARLSPYSVCRAREKCEIAIVSDDPNSEEVESKWLKGGYPRISARGYIIISKINI